MAEDDRWADYRLPMALIPPIPVQEEQAEAQRLPGAETVEAPAAPYAVPAGTGVEDTAKVPAEAGTSTQVPVGPDVGSGAGNERHEHYWIHTTTETIERGNADGEAWSMLLQDGKPQQVFGLNDLRTRACIAPAAEATGPVYFGKRDRINGSDPASAFWIASGGALEVRSRNEWWVLFAPGDGSTCRLSVVEWKSEPTEGTLGKQTSG
jgi:hypothetical protein